MGTEVADAVQEIKTESATTQTPETQVEEKPVESLLSGSEEQKGEESTSPTGDVVSSEDPAGAEAVKTQEIEYTDFSVPDGFDINAEVLEEFKGIAKGIGLSQENAQALVDLQTKVAKANLDRLDVQQKEALKSLRESWVTDLKNDPEFGRSKFDQTVLEAKRAFNRYGSKDLLKTLDDIGLSDNPEIIKMLARVDRATAEDSSVSGGPATKMPPQTLADALYT